jgi:NADPH-dependent glutamate synthase beta subunit-like oxidoreductase
MGDSTVPVEMNGPSVSDVDSHHDQVKLPQGPLSGIDVLIVGAGIGGLNAAVELYRHGHNVQLVEAKSKIEGLVGMTTFQANESDEVP